MKQALTLASEGLEMGELPIGAVIVLEGRVIALGAPAELRAATGQAEATLEDAFLYFIKRGEEQKDVN